MHRLPEWGGGGARPALQQLLQRRVTIFPRWGNPTLGIVFRGGNPTLGPDVGGGGGWFSPGGFFPGEWFQGGNHTLQDRGNNTVLGWFGKVYE